MSNKTIGAYQPTSKDIGALEYDTTSLGGDDPFFENRVNAIADQQAIITAHTLNGVLNT